MQPDQPEFAPRDETTGGLVALPGFQTGGRIERTGIALVHEGEYIVPAPGSEALITPALAGGQVINYYFPIEVEVVGMLTEAQVQRVAEHVFGELSAALRS
jgi:hypothetical protein